MAEFTRRSQSKLDTCDERLQRLFAAVVEYVDCTVIIGHRPQEAQDRAFELKLSKLKWPLSKHNSTPSKAIDVAPYPINWDDRARFYYFGGFVKAMAIQMGLKIRWGGDWDSDNDFSDQTFMDLVHFELID